MRKRWLLWLFPSAAAVGWFALGGPLLADAATREHALSYGQGSCGKLSGGTALPCSGPNFEACSVLACALGRNYLHPLATETLLEAYSTLAKQPSSRRWQYGDLGFQNGGRLRPHRTHQSGRAADFFVPVVDAAGAPALVPISATNRFGYGVEFSENGRLGELRIDWHALTDHLLALEAAGRARGVGLERIILAPELRDLLLGADPRAARFRDRFMKGPAWVRHDEHYHVDFSLPPSAVRPMTCPK